MVNRLLLLLFIGLLSGGARAQGPAYLPYHARDTAQLYQLATAHRAALQRHFVLPKGANAEYREHFHRIVAAASADMYNSVRYTALLDTVLNPYVQAVFGRIVQANPGLPPAR